MIRGLIATYAAFAVLGCEDPEVVPLRPDAAPEPTSEVVEAAADAPSDGPVVEAALDATPDAKEIDAQRFTDAGPDGAACEPVFEAGTGLAPEFEGANAWLNTPEALRLADFRGEVVLVDFWTYGCINCLHQMPVLREIEDALEGEPFAAIGVHSAKFEKERAERGIELAMEQYGVRHPVAVDSKMKIWGAYGAYAWPTTVLIDAQGRVRLHRAGEFQAKDMLIEIRALIDEAKRTCTAVPTPRPYLTDPVAGETTPLLFPTGVLALADGRLAISDSAHFRVVVLETAGGVADIYGAGVSGYVDGPAQEARFARPQGLAFQDGVLYVGDAENDAIRAIDTKKRTVSTVAGTGKGGRHLLSEGWLDAKTTDIRSPWDLEPAEGGIAVAMAGTHQLYLFDPAGKRIRVLSGTGYEDILDGAAEECWYAQPSGLATSADGQTLYVADPEASAVRSVKMADGSCKTLVGQGLFAFGDVDGVGDQVLLEHAIGIETLDDDRLLIADTYNSKVKELVPSTRTVTTLAWPSKPLSLDQPRSLSRRGDVVYVSDTNHHRILAHDLVTEETTVVDLGDLEPPSR